MLMLCNLMYMFREDNDQARPTKTAQRFLVGWSYLCTPVAGVNLWGGSPLCVNPITI